MSEYVQALLGGLIFLILFIATAVLAVPLATRLIGIVLKPYKIAHKEIALIERYIIAVVWLSLITIGLGRLVTLAPFLKPFGAVILPAIEGVEAALGVFKWTITSLAVLVAGCHIAAKRRD